MTNLGAGCHSVSLYAICYAFLLPQSTEYFGPPIGLLVIVPLCYAVSVLVVSLPGYLFFQYAAPKAPSEQQDEAVTPSESLPLLTVAGHLPVQAHGRKSHYHSYFDHCAGPSK